MSKVFTVFRKYQICLIACILLMVFFACRADRAVVLSDSSDSIELKTNWSYRWGDSQKNHKGQLAWLFEEDDSEWKTLNKLWHSGKRESNHLWVKTRLPKGKWKDPALYLGSVFQIFEVYLDDHLIYKFGDLNKIHEFPGHRFLNIISLPKNYAGRTLSLRIHSDFSRIGPDDKVLIGERAHHFKEVIINELDDLLQSFFIFFTGLAVLMLSYQKRDRRAILAFGFFITGMFISQLVILQTTTLFIDLPLLMLYVRLIAVYSFPIPALIFLEELFGREFKKRIRFFLLMHIIFLVGAISMSLAGLVPLMSTVMPFNLIVSISVVFGLYIVIKKSLSDSNARIFVAGILSLAILTLHDVLVDLDILDHARLSGWGAVVLISSMAVVLIRRYIKVNLLVQFFSRELRKKNRELTKINGAYVKFVPREFLQNLEKNSIVDVGLGDNVQKNMMIMFSDIRSYTTLSESMSPEENFNFLNAILGRIGPIIKDHGGFVSQYLGDGIMALFSHTAEDSINASIAMQNQIRDYNVHRIKKNREPVRIGIGLHAGKLMLGIIGDGLRLDDTVVSDAVNLASRIEGLTKIFGASILISDDVLKEMKDPTSYDFRFLGLIGVHGKQNPVSIFEILDGSDDEIKEKKNNTRFDFEKGLNHYLNENFEEARTFLNRVLDSNPDDGASLFYRQRCDFFIQHGLPPEWEGIERLDIK